MQIFYLIINVIIQYKKILFIIFNLVILGKKLLLFNHIIKCYI